MLLFTIYFLLITIIVIIWYLLRHIYSYWERKGFPYIKPTIPFGNMTSVIKKQRSFGMAIYDLYQSTTEPFIGIYQLFRPSLLVRDVELVKMILVKEFPNFHDRGVYSDENDTFSQNLFSLPGSKWKTLRNKLTPAFSSGKLKNMFETITNVGKTMTDYLNFIVPLNGGTIVDMRDVCSRFAVDIIANVIFGLEVNSFAEPNNAFRRVTETITSPTITDSIRGLAVFLCPRLFKFLPIQTSNPYTKKFLIDITKKTIMHREQTNEVRKDLMQLLLQLRNTGKLNLDDNMWNVETVAENLKSMSIEMIAGQLFLFYIAGSETTSSTAAYCLHELVQNKDIMKKVLDDIDNTLEKHNGYITYDSIKDMKYLDLCVMETTRKYPGLPILNRECTENFNIPGTKYVIEKGTAIVISLMGLHRDPNYFPEPMKFDPERYIEGKKNYVEEAFLPFGDGPRACIALRLGKINVKVALAMLLSLYEFEATETKEIEFTNDSVGILPKNGIKLMISRRRRKILKFAQTN